jgi:hypothetical protein
VGRDTDLYKRPGSYARAHLGRWFVEATARVRDEILLSEETDATGVGRQRDRGDLRWCS